MAWLLPILPILLIGPIMMFFWSIVHLINTLYDSDSTKNGMIERKLKPTEEKLPVLSHEELNRLEKLHSTRTELFRIKKKSAKR